ncbi:MAG TPA: type II toxin-antitoxin system prevent-host-death family antitoxin [Stellaceae bacterium]|nr:type II toxin-antitoxin system prevent-host-death family antitoxin [Stellaceae bacterium]
MSAEISIAQAKAGFAALVARAEAGERIVVTRNGLPVACLGPLPENKPIKYGDLAHLAPLFGDLPLEALSLPEEVLADFEKSIEDFEWP